MVAHVAIELYNLVKSQYGLIIFVAGWIYLAAWFQLNRRLIAAALIAVAGAIVTVYIPWYLQWFANLGADSFSNLQSFDIQEALFFLTTVQSISADAITDWKPRLAVIILGFALACVLHALVLLVRAVVARGRLQLLPQPLLGLALVLLPIVFQVHFALQSFRLNSDFYSTIESNFSSAPVNAAASDWRGRNLHVVLYIGESTSILNMGLYGYPRNTTPLLGELRTGNDRFLTFSNVFSTHVHTSESLLQALSTGDEGRERFIPIEQRRRTSLIDILAGIQVPTLLLSNQGKAGTWNLAGSLIFRNATERIFSVDSSLAGNLDDMVRRPPDHEFFRNAVRRGEQLPGNGPRVTILHSYAGHGYYRENIPESFRERVDDLLISMNPEAILGDRLASEGAVRSIDAYDSAVRYIDFSIASVAQQVEETDVPTVLVYFSDHGEAMYAVRGHDAARFVHEMARVPFIIYFNLAASNRYPELLERFKGAAREDRLATLAQLPATLLDLLGHESGRGAFEGIGFDAVETLPPILVRETSGGLTYIPLSEAGLGTPSLRDASDVSTEIFRARSVAQAIGSTLCQHRSNSLAKALRGALVADCLEVDVVVESDGTISVRHTDAPAAGLELSVLSDVAERHGRALWVDAKNIDRASACDALHAFFAGKPYWHGRDVLIEFPPETDGHALFIQSCSRGLRRMGFRTSYYVPTETAVGCANAITLDRTRKTACEELEQVLNNALESGSYTDFSFDHDAVAAMQHLPTARHLSWNTWNVNAEDVGRLDASRFKMIIVESGPDPNTR
jgi:glucan phosphoethanolaminetransferase (alkaline phosphatase superfamily)